MEWDEEEEEGDRGGGGKGGGGEGEGKRMCVCVCLFVCTRPMDFLISPRYRVPYLLVFTILAIELLFQLLSVGTTPQYFKDRVYLNIIYKIC